MELVHGLYSFDYEMQRINLYLTTKQRKFDSFKAEMHYMDANKTAREETRWQLHKNAACNPQQGLAAAPHETPTVRPPAPYHEIYSS